MSTRPPPPIRPSRPSQPARTRVREPNFAQASMPEYSADRSGVVPRPSDFEHFVRIDKHGRVMTGHGQVEELAALAAYAMRMGDLIGELLQFGRSVALEATLSRGALFVYRDGGGEIVGVKPHARMSLRQLRTRLNL
jgi:hypothetical protein